MALYDSIDLDWTWDGDFIEGEDGDIKDTAEDYITSLHNEIRTVIRSEYSDWQAHPVLGCNLSDFRGEANTRKTAEAIKARIISRLVAAGAVRQEDVFVRVIPVHAHQVLIIIRINTTPTVNNSLEPGEPTVVAFTYDSLEDSVFFLPPSQLERNYKGL